MKKTYSKNLRRIAGASALYGSSSVLLVCDGDLCVCMKSLGAEKSIKQPMIGTCLITHLDAGFREALAEAGLSGVRGEIIFDSTAYGVTGYHGNIGGEDYFVFVYNESQSVLPDFEGILSDHGCITELQRYVGEIIDELMHSAPDADTSGLDRNCARMIRIMRYVAATCDTRLGGTRNQSVISVNSFLNYLCELCLSTLPAFGCRILPTLKQTDVYYCRCNAKVFTTFICGLLFSTIAISKNKCVGLSCRRLPGTRTLSLEFETDTSVCELCLRGRLDDFASRVKNRADQPFVLELMLCAEIAADMGWESEYSCNDGKFLLKIEIPEDISGLSAGLLREIGSEDDFIRQVVDEFCRELSL